MFSGLITWRGGICKCFYMPGFNWGVGGLGREGILRWSEHWASLCHASTQPTQLLKRLKGLHARTLGMIDLAGSSSLYMQRAVSMCVCVALLARVWNVLCGSERLQGSHWSSCAHHCLSTLKKKHIAALFAYNDGCMETTI